MSDKPEKSNTSPMSADDFFQDDPQDKSAQQVDPMYNVGDQVKDQLRTAGYEAGSNFIVHTLVNLLPLPYRHKRNLTQKISRGEPVNIWDVLLGGFSVFRIIRLVIGAVIFAGIALFLMSRGLI